MRMSAVLSISLALLCKLALATQLELSQINPNLIDAQYAVRGAILDKAEEFQKQIDANPQGHGLPFDSIVPCNIGNPQVLGQKPLSFNREVLSLVMNRDLLEKAEASPGGTLGGAFKADAVRRARMYLTRNPEGLGAYSNSQGWAVVREEVADFIAQRDGHPSDPEQIFLTDGASAGVRMFYQTMLRPGQPDGMLVPIPQYPLYSALTTLFGGHLVGYYLDESASWEARVSELERALKEARAKGTNVRGLVVINPGNPTGQCLDLKAQQEIVAFVVRENLVLFADEVYQENIIAEGKKFNSFKKVALDMAMDAEKLELISFHTASKGFMGECGIRGGYFELHNIDPEAKAMLYKLASITLCSNTPGQLSIGLMVNPPKEGDESHEAYVSERDGILESLKRRAIKLGAALNKLEGISVNPPEGAMYLFPQVQLPKAAVQAANKAGMAADGFYCMELLKATGIVTVPGSGFRQVDGTWHFRTTFLPAEDKIDTVISRMTVFNDNFMRKFKSSEL